MDKSPDAFRTISEVAEVLDIPAHVLRFWESRFPQIRPVKRAGGRRYYRPADVALLTGIKRLLHDEGMTIRGVQKILREQGVRHVAGLSGDPVPDETEDAEAALEAALAANFGSDETDPPPQAEIETAQIVALETALRDRSAEDAPEAGTPAEVVSLFETTETESGAAPEPTTEPEPVPEAAHWQDPELDDAEAAIAAVLADEGQNADSPAPPQSLAARLRQLPAAALAATPEAEALLLRLRSLQARMEAPPPRQPL